MKDNGLINAGYFKNLVRKNIWGGVISLGAMLFVMLMAFLMYSLISQLSAEMPAELEQGASAIVFAAVFGDNAILAIGLLATMIYHNRIYKIYNDGVMANYLVCGIKREKLMGTTIVFNVAAVTAVTLATSVILALAFAATGESFKFGDLAAFTALAWSINIFMGALGYTLSILMLGKRGGAFVINYALYVLNLVLTIVAVTSERLTNIIYLMPYNWIAGDKLLAGQFDWWWAACLAMLAVSTAAYAGMTQVFAKKKLAI